MAKGKPTSKIAKGAKGRKNHGPKRHLNHDIAPKALRMEFSGTGALSKYDSFDAFCVSMSDRHIRADYKLLWYDFCTVKALDETPDNPDGTWLGRRAAQKAWFATVRERAQALMSAEKKKEKANARK